jgi:hypothetical protein
MKTILFGCLSVGLLFLPGSLTLGQEEEAPKAAPAKTGPDPGKLEIQVTSGDKSKTYEHPSKALTDISRAAARAKKAKEGEEPAFQAEIHLNEQVFTFTDPEAAQEACKALSTAMRELPKLKMGLGDLGAIPEAAAAETTPMPNATGNRPMAPKNQAAATAEVRRRINAALQRQLVGTGGGGVSIRYPTPQQMQQTINAEIEKARAEGLLPANASAANAGAGLNVGDPREAKKEALVQTLAFAFAKADGAEQPAEEAAPKPEEK